MIVFLVYNVLGRGETGYEDSTRSLAGGVGGTKTLSAVNLLLPISTCNTCGRVKQEIRATNGCYQWDNSHPGLISMTRKDGSKLDNNAPDSRQEESECLDSVIVEAASRKETKTLIWITAKDKSNKHSIILTFEFRFRLSSSLRSENWEA